jgi:hypothetical protein
MGRQPEARRKTMPSKKKAAKKLKKGKKMNSVKPLDLGGLRGESKDSLHKNW